VSLCLSAVPFTVPANASGNSLMVVSRIILLLPSGESGHAFVTVVLPISGALRSNQMTPQLILILGVSLDWDLKNRFGTRDYAAEELVAELASAFLCAEFGINKETRHASYIAHWIELLKADDRAFFTAASKAQKAADYLRGLAQAEPMSEVSA
jgi:hypothetical protein